jgi:UDP-N-acetylmuramate--alanine ligase
MWVVFQPHQHARTRLLMEDFATAFTGADEIIVPDIYGARETGTSNERNGSEELVTRICRNGGRAHYVPALALAAEHIVRHVSPGDLVLTMGAGDIWKVADELVERICGQHAARRAARATHLVSTGRSGEVSMSAA